MNTRSSDVETSLVLGSIFPCLQVVLREWGDYIALREMLVGMRIRAYKKTPKKFEFSTSPLYTDYLFLCGDQHLA